MAHIIDYVKQAKEPLKRANFSVPDAMVLTLLSYLHFEKFKDRTRLWKIAEHPDSAIENTRVPELNKALLIACAQSPRFRRLRIYRYHEDTNLHEVKQFAAVTFFLDWRTVFVAFRGTDGTLNGWQEDFNMAFMDEVPAQRQAKEYFYKIVHKYTWCRIGVGGHSKGGNLAIYAAAKLPSKLQKRVPFVYNLDGPGFKPNISQSEPFQAMRAKVTKTVPEYSVIGMLLQDNGDYKTVRSDGAWLTQHEVYNWIIDEKTWQPAWIPALHPDAIKIRDAIYNWLSGIEEEKRRLIIDSLFEILRSGGVISPFDLIENWKTKAGKLISQYLSLDKESRVTLRKSLWDLAKNIKRTTRK